MIQKKTFKKNKDSTFSMNAPKISTALPAAVGTKIGWPNIGTFSSKFITLFNVISQNFELSCFGDFLQSFLTRKLLNFSLL